MYTTQGLTTAGDLYDHQLLHDLGMQKDCPGHQDDVGTYFCSVNDEPCSGEED